MQSVVRPDNIQTEEQSFWQSNVCCIGMPPQICTVTRSIVVVTSHSAETKVADGSVLVHSLVHRLAVNDTTDVPGCTTSLCHARP